MDELGLGIESKAVCNEVLYGKLGLGISGRDVDHQPLDLSSYHLVKSIAYLYMVVTYDELIPRLLLEDITGKVKSGGQCERPLYVNVSNIHRPACSTVPSPLPW